MNINNRAIANRGLPPAVLARDLAPAAASASAATGRATHIIAKEILQIVPNAKMSERVKVQINHIVQRSDFNQDPQQFMAQRVAASSPLDRDAYDFINRFLANWKAAEDGPAPASASASAANEAHHRAVEEGPAPAAASARGDIATGDQRPSLREHIIQEAQRAGVEDVIFAEIIEITEDPDFARDPRLCMEKYSGRETIATIFIRDHIPAAQVEELAENLAPSFTEQLLAAALQAPHLNRIGKGISVGNNAAIYQQIEAIVRQPGFAKDPRAHMEKEEIGKNPNSLNVGRMARLFIDKYIDKHLPKEPTEAVMSEQQKAAVEVQFQELLGGHPQFVEVAARYSLQDKAMLLGLIPNLDNPEEGQEPFSPDLMKIIMEYVKMETRVTLDAARVYEAASHDPEIHVYRNGGTLFSSSRDVVLAKIRGITEEEAFKKDPEQYVREWQEEHTSPFGISMSHEDIPMHKITEIVERLTGKSLRPKKSGNGGTSLIGGSISVGAGGSIVIQ